MRRPRFVAPLPCAVVLALFIALTGAGRRPPSIPMGATVDDRTPDRITGTLGGPVLATPRGFGARLSTETSSIWIWSRTAIEPGQRVTVIGRLRTPRGFLDPGSPDREVVAAGRGCEWELSATSIEVVADVPDAMDRTWRWAARTQRELVRQIEDDGQHEPARGALEGIVTGNRTHIPEDLDARWRAVGIYHVLSVSGLHLAVIAGLAYALLRRLAAASPLGRSTRPARWAAPAALVLAIGYTLVTGAQLATLRALLVVAIVLVARMLDRPIRLVDALGAAAIVLLAWRPNDLHDPSFQLSFVAALTLALLPPPDALASTSRRHRVWRWLRRGLVTSAWVTITTAPITAFHFHQVAAGGVVGNLVLTPLVELAALPLGLAGAILGNLGADAIGSVLVDAAVWIVARVDDVAGVLAHAIPLGAVALSSSLVTALLVALALWSCGRRRRARIELVVWGLLCAIWAIAPAAIIPGSLRVTFLDVGQGDAALVELPNGAVWLVDAGGVASSHDVTSASAPGHVITRALAVYGHRAIDLAIVSHPHPDHYLGLAAIAVPVRELWFVTPDRPYGTFGAIVDALVARGTRIGTPTLGERRTDGVTVQVWGPRYASESGAAEQLAVDPVRSVNDNSLVLSIEYGGRTILFGGDLEAEGEHALVAAGVADADVVKIAHHGSRTSSSPEFVAATRPSFAVISCGVGNAFEFPAPEVVARWAAAGATVARTDLDGAITVTIGPTGRLVVDRYRHHGP